jgi:hypothetical protein
MAKGNKFNHGDRESRRRRAQERLGSDKASCLLCDVTDAFVLELHHVAGRKYDDETVPLCLTHHGQASEFAKDHPAKIEGCKNQMEAIGHFLLGLGDLAHITADELRDPMLANFLMYLRLKLKVFGLLLVKAARRSPDLDYGFRP